MNALIVENEINVINALERLLLSYCPEVTSIAKASTKVEALLQMAEVDPDIVFMDVELDECTGLDILDEYGDFSFQLIFVTAFDRYAIDAFRYSALDYLLKPVDPDDLVQAVARAKSAITTQDDHQKYQVLVNNLRMKNREAKKMIITDRDNIYSIDINSILYLKADGPYTHVKRKGENLFTSKNLKYYENMLSTANFCRVHHGYLVNLEHMKRYDKIDSEIELNSGERVPVSVRKRDKLLRAIKIHTSN